MLLFRPKQAVEIQLIIENRQVLVRRKLYQKIDANCALGRARYIFN
jgi:hypothetical protein